MTVKEREDFMSTGIQIIVYILLLTIPQVLVMKKTLRNG